MTSRSPRPGPEQPRFSETLGSLRGLAASVVVLYHGMMICRLGTIDDAHDLAIDPSSPALVVQHALLGLFNGSAAVIVFFVLSGTVLSLSMAREAHLGPREVAAYYVKRGFRLGPLLAVVAVIAGFLHLRYFGPEEYEFATTWMNWHFKHDPTIEEIAANAVGWSDSLNSPAWTIFVEIVASLLFPALFLLAAPEKPRLAIFGTLVLLAFVPLPLRGVHMFMMCFYAGALIPTVGGAVAVRFGALPRWARVASIALALAALAWFQRVYAPAAFADPLVILVNTLAATFLVTVVYFDPHARLLRSRALLFLGEISYALYLTHLLVLFVIVHALAPHISAPLPAWQAIMVNLAFGVAALAATVPIATASYYLLERPFQDIGRTIARRIRQGGFANALAARRTS